MHTEEKQPHIKEFIFAVLDMQNAVIHSLTVVIQHLIKHAQRKKKRLSEKSPFSSGFTFKVALSEMSRQKKKF